MNHYQPADIRNFVITGHATCGKTMLSEAMLACSGEIGRIGSIEKGTTISDYHISEKEHQISVHATPLTTQWQEKKFNIIDAPGYSDFISEGLGALRVGDFALIVINGIQGVEIGTEQAWDYASRFDIPKILVVNMIDKEGCDFEAILNQAREKLDARVFPMTVPINPGPGFDHVLDVLRSEQVVYKLDQSGKFEERPAEGEWKQKVRDLHRELIEFVAESDNSLLEKFFENEGLTEEEMRSGIHAAVQNQHFVPMFCTSAITDVGVARLMDFIAKYGSSPVDRKKIKAEDVNGNAVEVALSDPDPVLYVFKTMNEPQVGEVSIFRMYAGTVHPGMDLYNSSSKVSERIGQVFVLNGQKRIHAERLEAGDIGAFVKLRHTHTGNTLCTEKRQVILSKVQYPHPNIHAALQVTSKGEEDKLAEGLQMLHEEDPTFLFHTDGELKQTVVSAQGELHLKVIQERLKRRFHVEVELKQPKIRYRETIRAKAESKYRHKKQSGGAGQFAEVWMRIEPGVKDSGVEFIQSLVGQNVDRSFVPSVEKGVRQACEEGILAGYNVVDLKVNFYDGKMHPVDSKDIAFQIAGYHAFKEAFLNARPCLLEPIHNIEVRSPEDCVGKVMGDLTSRRGKILGLDSEDHYQVIKAQVPAGELYNYAGSLRSLTGGRGVHSESFSHYEDIPKEAEKKVIEDSKRRREE